MNIKGIRITEKTRGIGNYYVSKVIELVKKNSLAVDELIVVDIMECKCCKKITLTSEQKPDWNGICLKHGSENYHQKVIAYNNDNELVLCCYDELECNQYDL